MPKGKRHPATMPIKRDPAVAINKALASLEAALGGRDAILSTLVQAELTPEEEILVNRLADRDWDDKSLARVAGSCSFTVGQVLSLLTKAAGAKAYALALGRVYAHLPAVAEDIAKRSIPHQERCEACRALGIVKRIDTDEDGNIKKDDKGKKVWVEDQCWPCQGTGYITIYPDLERQKLALQIGGLLKGDKAPVVNLDMRTQSAVFKTDADFRTATDKLLFPRITVVPQNGNNEDEEDSSDGGSSDGFQ